MVKHNSVFNMERKLREFEMEIARMRMKESESKDKNYAPIILFLEHPIKIKTLREAEEDNARARKRGGKAN